MTFLHACKLNNISLVRKFMSSCCDAELLKVECFSYTSNLSIFDCIFEECKKRNIKHIILPDRFWICMLAHDEHKKIEYFLMKQNDGLIAKPPDYVFNHSKNAVKMISIELLLSFDHPIIKNEIERRNRNIVFTMLLYPKNENVVKNKRKLLDLNAVALSWKY